MTVLSQSFFKISSMQTKHPRNHKTLCAQWWGQMSILVSFYLLIFFAFKIFQDYSKFMLAVFIPRCTPWLLQKEFINTGTYYDCNQHILTDPYSRSEHINGHTPKHCHILGRWRSDCSRQHPAPDKGRSGSCSAKQVCFPAPIKTTAENVYKTRFFF